MQKSESVSLHSCFSAACPQKLHRRLKRRRQIYEAEEQARCCNRFQLRHMLSLFLLCPDLLSYLCLVYSTPFHICCWLHLNVSHAGLLFLEQTASDKPAQ